MPREVEKTYGCFRCGVLQGPISYDKVTERVSCGECGERGIVSFKQALDMLNELYGGSHHQKVMEAMDIDEYYIEEAESEQS